MTHRNRRILERSHDWSHRFKEGYISSASGVAERGMWSGKRSKGSDICKWKKKPPLLGNAYYVTSCGREFDLPCEHQTGDPCPGCKRDIEIERKK